MISDKWIDELEQDFKNTYRNWENLARVDVSVSRQNLIEGLLNDVKQAITQKLQEEYDRGYAQALHTSSEACDKHNWWGDEELTPTDEVAQ